MATARQMQVRLSSEQRRINARVREVWDWLKANNSEGAIARALERGDFEAAIKGLDRAAEALARATRRAYVASADASAPQVARALDIPFEFDATNRASVAYLERERVRLIREVTRAQRDAITADVRAGMMRGDNPLTIARSVRQHIGLTGRQVEALDAYRTGLMSRAQPPSPARIEAMVAREENRRIGNRAKTIARTESLRAVNAGDHATWRQIVAEGDVGADDIERKWIHYHRPGERVFHRAMHGQTRGLDAAFESGLGNLLMFPGDPSAPITETANCTCTVVTRLVVMTGGRAARRAA